MTKHFNKTSEKRKRIELRRNQTKAEDIIWQFLRDKKMCGVKFKRQYSIGNFVVDFYAPKCKLAIELDGKIHKFQKEYDNYREDFIKEAKVAFLRFSNENIECDVVSALDKISKTIQKLNSKL